MGEDSIRYYAEHIECIKDKDGDRKEAM